MPKSIHNVLIMGASGHARVCLEILEAQSRVIHGFYDDDPTLMGTNLYGYPVLGKLADIIYHLNIKTDDDFIIAIGNNYDRKNVAESIVNIKNKLPINAIHPSAVISSRVKIGFGNFIAAGVIINTGTILGNYVIVNTGATIDHDNYIHDFSQISPGCNLAGNVTIEEGAFIGTGAIIIPGKTIGAGAIIGAGAVVINDIPSGRVAVGIPARVIR